MRRGVREDGQWGRKRSGTWLAMYRWGDKGSVHSGALVAQEEHGHRAGAAMGADDGADVAQADLALQVGEALLQRRDEQGGVLRTPGVADEAALVVVPAALSVLVVSTAFFLPRTLL